MFKTTEIFKNAFLVRQTQFFLRNGRAALKTMHFVWFYLQDSFVENFRSGLKLIVVVISRRAGLTAGRLHHCIPHVEVGRGAQRLCYHFCVLNNIWGLTGGWRLRLRCRYVSTRLQSAACQAPAAAAGTKSTSYLRTRAPGQRVGAPRSRGSLWVDGGYINMRN